MTEPDPKLFVQHLLSLEKDFGLPGRFLIELRNESDWSFTIKLHSLIEAAVTQAVIAELGEPRLSALVEEQTLLGRFGKMAMAEALQVLPNRDAAFVKRLTKIRNHVVHKLAALTFDYPSYIASLDPAERKNTLRELLVLGDGPEGKTGELFDQQPRLALWVNALSVVTRLVGRRARAELNASIQSHYRRVAEDILGPLKELE